MKNRLKDMCCTLLLGLWTVAVMAQDIPEKVDVDIDINSDGGGWYTNWWIWGLIGMVFIVVIVAITNRGRSER